MKKILLFVVHLCIFIGLTVLTQIGGFVYLMILTLRSLNRNMRFPHFVFAFLGLYVVSTLWIVPHLAPLFGREKVQHTENIRPTNYLTVLLNRNYVVPKMNQILQFIEKDLEGSNISIHYLDANFPFWDGFPLLPHRSHDDGEKLDLSLIYQTSTGEISNKQKSISGYGIFEDPKVSEYNQIKRCLSQGYFQYDYPKYLTFGRINSSLEFSEKGTKRLLIPK